jgi:hypothetical protein
MLPRYNAPAPERRLNSAFTPHSAGAQYGDAMRTRTLIVLLVICFIALAVGMSAHGGHSGGVMRRLARAIHGQHGGPH